MRVSRRIVASHAAGVPPCTARRTQRRVIPSARYVFTLAAVLLAAPGAVTAQISIYPPSIEPAAWERIAVRVVSQSGPATVDVRIDLPDAIGVLGVDAPPGWTARFVPATDSGPQAIHWSGGRIEQGDFREFAFLGRLAADVRQRQLTFPIRLVKEDGTTIAWARGAEGAPPRIRIEGTTTVSSWSAFALAGAALGIAVLALILAVRRRTEP